jgi:hypothetical protein
LLSFWLGASCHGNMFCRSWISIWLSYLVSGLALFIGGLECYLVNFETLGMWLKKLKCYLGKWWGTWDPTSLASDFKWNLRLHPPLFLDSSSYHIDLFLDSSRRQRRVVWPGCYLVNSMYSNNGPLLFQAVGLCLYFFRVLVPSLFLSYPLQAFLPMMYVLHVVDHFPWSHKYGENIWA